MSSQKGLIYLQSRLLEMI